MNPLDGCQQSDQRNDTGKRYNIKRKVKWAQVYAAQSWYLNRPFVPQLVPFRDVFVLV